jgi:hypothetical protein
MGMRFAVVAIAAVIIVGARIAPVRAQQTAAPQQLVTDVTQLVFDLANSMGMLRGLQQEDSILTLEHWAKGTLTVGQQRFDVPEYRFSINYSVPGCAWTCGDKRPAARRSG